MALLCNWTQQAEVWAPDYPWNVRLQTMWETSNT